MARRRRPEVSGLQTTVMVDVLFILLIFFILVSRVRDSTVDVTLPEVESSSRAPSPDQPPDEPIRLAIARDGGLFLDDVAVADLGALRAALEPRKATRTPVLLSADREARTGVAIGVIHVLSEMGFEAVSFEALSREGEGGP